MVPDQDIYISPELQDRINADEHDFLQRVRGRGYNKSEIKAQSSHRYPMDLLESLLGRDKLKSAKILEIGSGNGFFLCYALKQGLDIIGTEPGEDDGFNGRYQRIVELLEENKIPDPKSKILNDPAENLPFAENTFDMVVSTAVLEHVQDLDASVMESLRVLKPGGLLWANLPNYEGTHEAHYNLFWIPRMTKNMARKWVSWFGRDSSLIDRLNFTTPDMFNRYSRYGDLSMYLYGKPWLNFIFVAYNYCCNSRLIPLEPVKRSVVAGTAEKILRNGKCREVLSLPLATCVGLLDLLGQSTVFDVIIYKRDNQ